MSGRQFTVHLSEDDYNIMFARMRQLGYVGSRKIAPYLRELIREDARGTNLATRHRTRRAPSKDGWNA